MALTFPSSPTNGQVYTDTATGNRYTYDSTRGLWKITANTVAMSVSSTPPANVATGSLWFNREIGRTFVYYDDGDSIQWIETVPSGSIDTNTIAAYTGPIYNTLNSCYTSTNTSYIFANLAITTANTAFPNTPNVSYNGSFYVPNGTISIGTNSYPTGKFQVVTANGEIARYTATGASGGYNVLFIDNSTPWYLGSAKATIAGNINDLYLGSGYGTTNNLIFGVSGTEKVRLSNTGVGIGTTNPLAKLHIAVPNGYSSNGASRFTVNANTVLTHHISSSSYGGSAVSTYQYGLSFGPGGPYGVGSGTQSAIAISENGADGTAIGLFTTNNYAGGPNLNMIVDPAGRVTSPNQPYARVSKNNGNITGASVIVFNTVNDDTTGMYNSSTGRFTAPVTGRYLCTHGMFSVSGQPAWVKWRVNGTVITTTYSNITSGYTSVAGCMVLRMNASDYADIYVETGYQVYGNSPDQCWAVFTLLG